MTGGNDGVTILCCSTAKGEYAGVSAEQVLKKGDPRKRQRRTQ